MDKRYDPVDSTVVTSDMSTFSAYDPFSANRAMKPFELNAFEEDEAVPSGATTTRFVRIVDVPSVPITLPAYQPTFYMPL